MIICFNCPREAKDQLDRLLKRGDYKDFGEIIASALMNLTAIQREIDSGGNTLVLAQNHIQTDAPLSQPQHGSQPETEDTGTGRSVSYGPRVPQLFLLNRSDSLTPIVGEAPTATSTSEGDITPQLWLFGQYNKLLPLKATCRALVNLSQTAPHGLVLSEVAGEISKEAVGLGDYLKYHDQKHKLHRDHSLCLAFPTSGKGSEKSCLRFAHQFVGNVNKKGEVLGFPYEMMLLTRISGKPPRILLTEAGWRFGTIPNPVLEGTQATPMQKLSDEERSFLLEHVRTVPREYAAYKSILTAILGGATGPEEIDANLKKQLTKMGGVEIRDSFLSSQRAGVMSRMLDLGLIEKERQGIRLSYKVSDVGENFKGGGV